mmetsp:Transcript_14481/g.21790  ORF Transcript_14481/g.21790 Transcript_14481/m.21790 type:complete len:937 (+) Transcript_14481:98-2908(+)|eukprot:CAMPEP_0185038456 /NCGR_PEP_ID=MMETSP1103-20130426/34151_1 /TAXON_ID=36769 /ORGANISM="Paraphysomonas bandaiensis, Strain Caron Lab Isolate" /LENGTH=936 /DNA_ID=CAMNT_0027576889 /DNA_START=37 /DNA_END=2847 /DNA_ORIENTATION=-
MSEAGITLDSAYVLQSTEKETPSEVFCQEQGITAIGDLSEVLSLRKVDVSFNPISSLNRIEQLNQIRHLSAYCCRITDIECLCGIKRMEALMLQQNGISSIPHGNSFNKLRVLRLDRNQLTSVENLSICSNLRTLNISWNKLTSLEGIAGLQNLQELSVSHNNLTSLKHLRALPSLTELDVSYNYMKDLHGLQLLPTVEVLHAEHNAIGSIHIPQTYFSHLNKELDPAGGGSSTRTESKSDPSGVGSVAGSARSASNQTGTVSGSKRGKQPMSRKKSSASAGGEDKSLSAASSSTKTTGKEVVGLQCLAELYLADNNIKTLKGFDSYGTNLDTLDISNNDVSDSEAFLLAQFSKLRKLTDVCISGNPIPKGTLDDQSSAGGSSLRTTEDGEEKEPEVLTFEQALAVQCPLLMTVDGRAPPVPGADKKKKKRSRVADADVFHTWEDGSMSLADGSKEGNTEDETKVVPPAEQQEVEEDEEPFSDDDEFLRQAEKEAEEDYKSKNPRLVIETMLTREEILEKETVFRGLLERSKARLVEAVKNFVPLEMQTVEDMKLEKEIKAIHSTENTSTERGDSGAQSRENSKPTSMQRGNSTRSLAGKTKKPTMDLYDAEEGATAVADRSSTAGSEDGRGKGGGENYRSKAGKLRTAVSGVAGTSVPSGTTAATSTSIPASGAAIPRKICATHVEATKGKNHSGLPPTHFDSRMKRSVLRESSGGGQVQSARMAEETIKRSAIGVDSRKPNSARRDSERPVKQTMSTERSSSFSFGERRLTSSTSTVRVINSTVHRRGDKAEAVDDYPIDRRDGIAEEDGDGASSGPVTKDDDRSIQWAPVPPSHMTCELNTEEGNNAPGSLESLSSAINWQQVDHAQDSAAWEQQTLEELQEMLSPRYTPVTKAELVAPPGSKEGGHILKSFRVPSLEAELAALNSKDEKDDS